MDARNHWNNWILFWASIFAGFGVAHLIDDFLFGTPAEFKLSNSAAQLLGFFFFAALTGLIGLSGRGKRTAYRGLVIIGLLLALADILEHLPDVLAPGPFRNPPLSAVFSVGLVVSGIILAGVAYAGLRESDSTRPVPSK